MVRKILSLSSRFNSVRSQTRLYDQAIMGSYESVVVGSSNFLLTHVIELSHINSMNNSTLF